MKLNAIYLAGLVLTLGCQRTSSNVQTEPEAPSTPTLARTSAVQFEPANENPVEEPGALDHVVDIPADTPPREAVPEVVDDEMPEPVGEDFDVEEAAPVGEDYELDDHDDVGTDDADIEDTAMDSDVDSGVPEEESDSNDEGETGNWDSMTDEPAEDEDAPDGEYEDF